MSSAGNPKGRDGASAKVQVALDAPGRLLLSAQCGLPYLSDEARQRLAPLLSYQTMVVIAGAIAVLGGAHVIGAGFVADVILGAVTVIALGSETIDAARRLQTFYDLAMAARHPPDFDKAGREFAAFVTIVGLNVALALLLRKGPPKLPKLKPLDPRTLASGWSAYVEGLVFKVPRDKGILWSKVGARSAERLATSKGLTSLEMLLKREGFMELYAKQFGSFENVKAAKLEHATAEIWRKVSQRFAASLEGKVTAFVDNPELGKAIAKGSEPILVDELWEIAETVSKNSKITMVEMVDVKTGRTWLMQRSQILKATKTFH